MRKLLAAVSALAMSLALTTPAFAEDTGAGQRTITIESELKVPTIKVTIATAAGMTVNPYQMSVTVDSGSVTDSLIAPPALITNESDIKVNIKAAPSATIVGDVNVATADWTTTPPADKSIFMKLKMASGSSSDPKAIDWANVDSTQTTVIKTSDSAPVELTLEPKADDTHPTYGGYKIEGKSGGDGWTGSEKITVNVVFDIKAVVGP